MALDTGFGKVKLFDDFLGPAITTNEWLANSDGGTGAITLQVDGAALITTGTTDGHREALTQSLNWRASDGGPLTFEVRVKCVSEITTRAIFVGFTDLVTVENPIEKDADSYSSNASDAVGFMYDTDAAIKRWYCVGVKGDNDVTPFDTGVAPVADTYQTLRVVVDITGGATYFIDGALVGSRKNAVTASTDLTPIMLIENRTTTAARAINVDYVYVEKGRAAA